MKLVIESEADAWQALEKAVTEGGFPEDLRIEFKGWPQLKLDFSGKDWDSTVPSRVMSPLLDVQKDINRAFTSVRYNNQNLRKLKDEDRDDLEIVVKVEKGSSLFNADLWKQFSHIADAAFGRMNGDQVVITVIGLALSIAAPVMFKAWLAYRQKEREIQSRVELSQEESERLKIFAEAIKIQPSLQMARDDAQSTSNRLLKAVKPGDNVSIKGVSLHSEEVGEIILPERERSEDIHLEGEFYVLGNRTDKTEGFRITVRRTIDALTLNADVPIELPYDQKQIIQKAEWSKSKIKLWMTASILRGVISDAVVGSAAESDIHSESQ